MLSAVKGYGIIHLLYAKEKETRMKKWTAAGCLLWIVGLAAFIVGLNLSGGAKEWTTVIGTIAFMAGLGIVGAIWLKNRNNQENCGEKNTADQ